MSTAPRPEAVPTRFAGPGGGIGTPGLESAVATAGRLGLAGQAHTPKQPGAGTDSLPDPERAA